MISWPRCGAQVRQRALGLVPAVRAGVLPARHAEVEGLVEGVQLLGGLLAIGVAAGGRHRLVERGLVGQDEVLEAARQDLDALERAARGRGGLERVAGAAPFAEGFGQDLGHRAPGFARTTPIGGGPPERFESIAQRAQAPFHRAYRAARRRSGRHRRGRSRRLGPGLGGPSGRLRDRPCRLWPPSSGSSNASSSGRPRACSAPGCSRSSSSVGSSAPWRPSGWPRPTGRSCRTASSSTSHPADLAEFGDMTTSLAAELADGALSFARAHHYTLVDRPRVDLLADPLVERADIRGRRPLRRADRRGSRRRGDRRSERDADRCAAPDGAGIRPTRASTRCPGRRCPGDPAGDRSGRPDADGRGRGRRPDDRPGHRQRPRPARRPRLAPPRPDRRAPRHARLHGPRQHQRLARQRRARQRGRARGRATASRSATRSSSSRSAGALDLMDGFTARPVGRPAALPGAALPLPRARRSGRCCATCAPRRASRRSARAAGRRGVARRRAARRPVVRARRRSRPSAATSTTRSSSTTRSPRPSTRS